MKPNTILAEVASVASLKEAWRLLNKFNKKSRGISSTTIQDFDDRLEENLDNLSKELLSRNFRFSPVRGTTISKKGQKPRDSNSNKTEDKLANLRPLRIPEIRDRIVHKALAISIEKVVSTKFALDNECSFAYQKRKGIEDAIIKMGQYFEEGYKIIFEADIIKFFDTINSSNLIKRVQDALPDSSINHLLSSAINQELGNIDELKRKKVFEQYFEASEQGIPQGNALSPLLANIYLSDFDRRMTEEGFKLIRYADDFIVMCKTNEDAQRAHGIAVGELEGKLNLKLHPLQKQGKTRIVDPRQHEFTFLSVRFDGEYFRINKKKVDMLYEKISCLTSKEGRQGLYPNEPIGLFQALIKLKNMIEGWIAAYYFLDCDKQIQELDNYINVILVQMFNDFELTLKRTDLEEISLHGQRRKRLALSARQRKAIGIPLCIDTLTKARKEILPIAARIKLITQLAISA
jgi:RNA-directed DNA polymerase